MDLRRAAAAIGAALALLAAGVQAREPQPPDAVQPERPTVATHAGTVAPGWLELETGVELDRLHEGPREERTLLTPTTLKVGLAPRLQLSLVGSFVRTAEGGPARSGIGDVALGVKWRLAEDLPVLGDLAVLPSLKLPAGSARRGTGTGTTDAGLLLISSHEFGAVALDVNLGYTLRSGDGSGAPKHASLWTVSAGMPVAGALGWVAEVFGLPATSGPAGQRSTAALLTGPTFEVRRWLALDAGIIVPLAGPQPRAAYAGLVWNLGALRPLRSPATPGRALRWGSGPRAAPSP